MGEVLLAAVVTATAVVATWYVIDTWAVGPPSYSAVAALLAIAVPAFGWVTALRLTHPTNWGSCPTHGIQQGLPLTR